MKATMNELAETLKKAGVELWFSPVRREEDDAPFSVSYEWHELPDEVKAVIDGLMANVVYGAN